MNVTIVVNPHAGKQNILREISAVEKVFRDGGCEVATVQTETREQAKRLLEDSAEKPDVLVCCGGDGTLSETVNTLLNAGKTTPLGYIPSGSTNDFATFLGIPKEPVKAAQRIVSGEAKPIDVGRFGYKYFIYVASFGAFTQSSYSTTQSLKNSLGHLAYVIEGIKELPQIKSYHVGLETEHGTVEGDYVFGSVSNSTSFGGIIKMDPKEVAPADGLFEIMLAKMPKNLIELHKILFSLMSGKYDEEVITFLHARQALFTCSEPMPWSLDGEYAAGGERVEIEAVKQAVRLYY